MNGEVNRSHGTKVLTALAITGFLLSLLNAGAIMYCFNTLSDVIQRLNQAEVAVEELQAETLRLRSGIGESAGSQ